MPPLFHQNQWSIDSWKSYDTLFQAKYGDQDSYKHILAKLNTLPALVTIPKIKQLQELLAKTHSGEYFIIQQGDCAESFVQFSEDHLKQFQYNFDVLEKFVKETLNKKLIKIGRIAGQFAKPRSFEYENRDDVVLPIYRGDMINYNKFATDSRTHDPQRLLEAYAHSAVTINYLSNTDIYCSHEGLILDYEQSQVHQDDHGKYYDCSAHTLWIGNKSRNLNQAHVEFFRNISNPIGIKINHSVDIEELSSLLDVLNPYHISGKITLIFRLGREYIEDYLPVILSAIKDKSLLLMCDPMHGNTVRIDGNYKIRYIEDIKEEYDIFTRILKERNMIESGIHLEMSSFEVTECLSKNQKTTNANFFKNYKTLCDPRITLAQSLEII